MGGNDVGEYIDIPVQMMALTDRDGRITPRWFRLETKQHEVKTFQVEKTVSRGEKNYVGIHEKQFICLVRMGELLRTVELRCNTENQRWRITQLL